MTNQSALVGYTGFVGGNLHRQHQFDNVFNSKDISEIESQSFELLVLSGVKGTKWQANLDPHEDWCGIQRLINSLERVKARRVVLISSVDVLEPIAGSDEDSDPHGLDNHAYGLNRLRLEDILGKIFLGLQVVRLPSIFGPGLKKNVLFDLINSNQLEKINPVSSFQYYDLANIWEHVSLVLREGVPVINLVPEPVSSIEIIDRFFRGVEVGDDANPAIHYAYRTKYANLFGRSGDYIDSREEVFRRIGEFIEDCRRGGIR